VRRLVPILIGLIVVVAGLVGLMTLASGRDDAGLADRTSAGPGTYEPTSAGSPPTSGAHEQRNVTGEDAVDDDALLTALEQGNVVIAYPQAEPPAALRELQADLTGPFDAELAAAGQMVILMRRDDVDGIQALAYQRRLEAGGPSDPQLRAFAEAWLGAGRENQG
jgi:Protein of unknown function (DUF3105)